MKIKGVKKEILIRITQIQGKNKPLRAIFNGLTDLSDISYGHKLLRIYEKEGLVEINKKGRMKQIRLTKMGQKEIDSLCGFK